MRRVHGCAMAVRLLTIHTQVVVTAAGQGIGKASALQLAREGAAVTATDIRSD
jgi:NADP-dependent 3-hydroxy acid dehydrogenase YdfG